MQRVSLLTKTKTLFSTIPLKAWLIGGGVFVALVYSFIFFVPKPVAFSYAEQTCVGQLVIAPGLQKSSSADFSLSFKDELRIGSVSLASTKVCFEPTASPKSGTKMVAMAPFDGLFARKHFSVDVPKAPSAKSSDIVGRTISTAEPLKITLTSPDIIHSYYLKVADKKADCTQGEEALTCEVAALALAHSSKYTVALHQRYKDTDMKLVEGAVETLRPLVLTASGVSEGQTIYDAPTSFSFTFDRPIDDSMITLQKIAGDQATDIPVTVTKEGSIATATFEKLARETQYRITVTQAIGDNGSSLEAPLVTNFTMSGGPKVTSASVGAHSVARNASIIVTFDQPIDPTTDIAKLARIEGVAGKVSKKSDTQLAFAIEGGDCTAFKLIVDKGIISASNGEPSKDGWTLNSRTICGTSWVIGSSVKGRAIVAYSFGSGANTILFTGGIHGSERSGYTTMQAWVEHLQAYGDIIPADKRVVIVPNTNPDGIAVGSRNNSNNVNLGRNFPTANWSASIQTTSGTLPQGGGTSPGSEPEAAALIKLTRQLKPRLAISYHAQGRLVGANKFADSVSIGDIYANTVGYKTMYYNAEAVMGYPMTGELEDWMGEEMNIPAILIELPSPSGNYLSTQMAALKKMLGV